MHGDFSRGHRPDGKRGQTYTRAFAQQRRLLIDSDLNAATDALHERLRGLANHLGCPKGSPDLGYLVTPGRLLAFFRELDGVVTSSANFTLYRDYQNKYLDRYPSLHLAADQGGNGTVTVQLREVANGPVVVWCRADAAAVVTFDGNALAVPVHAAFQPVVANLVGSDVDLTVNAGGAIWIALIESEQDATQAPVFDYCGGHYYLDGLPLVNPADTSWVTNAELGGNVQVNNQNLAANDRLLVYLEGWERHITFVEDLGLLERALGGDTDTATRGRAVGQVKLAFVPANFDLTAFGDALNAPALTDGTLDVTTPPAPPNPDPCALPVQGGYTGRDNRFYRFEVHTGGALGGAVIKWSRDNGAELFAVSGGATNAELTFPSNTLLQGGDLVEILPADAIDLGDQAPAVLDGAATTFTPAIRSVGVLARLVGPTSNGGASFTLTGINGLGVVNLPAHYGPFPSQTLKVRRWHGLIETTAAPVPNDVEIENGIRVELAGTFTPGDYWQYEARADVANDNGPFQTTPHGPERDFGPLALMRFDGANTPLVLEAWLDDRFPPLCELTADDIAFDGDHLGSDSDTVQEIIEELWEKVGGGCCEFTLEPPQGDAAIPIREILQATQGEVTICFEPGVYNFLSTLDVANRRVILHGCPRAVFTGAINPIFHVTAGGKLVLEHLVVHARQDDNARVLVDLDADSAGFEARDAGLFAVPDAAAGVATIVIRVAVEEPPAFDPTFATPPAAPAPQGSGPALLLERVVASAGWAISATSVRALTVRDSAFECQVGCIWLERSTEVEVRTSSLIAGVSLDALDAWTPDALLDTRDALVSPLGDLDVDGFPASASIGFWAGAVTNGTISECRIGAGVAVAASAATLLDLHHNQHFVTHTGIHLVDADGCSISEETILSFEGTVGVIARSASSVSINDCELLRFATAIALRPSGSDALNCFNVQINGNRCDEVRVGVQIGANSSSTYTGQLSQVSITGNTIRAASAGVAVNALTIGSQILGVLELRPLAVRVAENQVTARVGIGVLGRDVEVADNVVRPVGGGGAGAFFGIVGLNTGNLICENNHIEISVPQEIPLPAMGGGNTGLLAAIVAANVQPAAIVLASGSGATVAGNVTHADAGREIRSLAAENHTHLSVKGNEFSCGPIACTNTDDLVCLDNTVLGRLLITGSASGQVADNRVQAAESLKLSGDLEVLQATGQWKVADNRADGAVRIVPTSTGGWTPPWFIDVGHFTLNRWNALDTLGRLSHNNRLIEDINVPIDDVAPGPAAAEDAATRERSAARYAMTNANWRADYRGAVIDYIGAAANDSLIEILDLDDIIVAAGFRENAYHVQCTANWANTLQVGVVSSHVTPNSQSVVQVVANRANDAMSVKHYMRLVMALNVAGEYTEAGNPVHEAIETLNLEV